MNQTNKRKLEHIKIVLEEQVESNPRGIYSDLKLPFKALPEIDMNEIDTSIDFLGKRISFPFLLSSMTGGPDKGKVINKNVALACEKLNIPFGVGSMRVIIKHPETIDSFNVKRFAPNAQVFANVGLVQLNYGFGLNEFETIIKSINADGLFLHINPLQEAIQPEGDTNYKGLLNKLEEIIKKISVPVIVKEVGTGVDQYTAKRLNDIGVNWIDISGNGGTHWGVVEAYRRQDPENYNIFSEIGVSTIDSITKCSKIEGLNLIAGGGIRSGIDIAKSIMLGAKLATAATPFLKPALTSEEEVEKLLLTYQHQLRITMFSMGVKNIEELNKLKIDN